MFYKSIIGLSGGLDSSMTAWTICNKGIRPLAVVVDNYWNKEVANENIMKIINHFKLDYLWIKVDQEQFFDLQEAFVKSGITNIEIPSDHILYALVYKVADMVRAKIIYNGGNTASENFMPEEWGYNPQDLRFIKAIHKKYGTIPMDKVPTLSLLRYLYYRFVKGIKILQPLNDIDYNIKQAKELLSKEIGWQDYGWKHCENYYTEWFQHWYLPRKFGIDKRKAHFQSLINTGQMTKEEANEELKKPMHSIEYHLPGYDADLILKIPKHTYKDFKNSEFIRKLLSNIFITCKNTIAGGRKV